MPNVNTQFQGSTLIKPGAYYDDNVTATQPTTPAIVPPLIFIGFGYGGLANTVYQHSSYEGLIAQLRGGPASSFAQFIYNPSTQLKGASLVNYINPAQNTASTLTLNNTVASVSTPAVVLTSVNVGTPSNAMQAEITAGSVGGIDLTIYDGYSNIENRGSNLGLPFQLGYTGSATTVTYSVTATEFTVGTGVAGDPENFSFALGSGPYATVTQLVEALNGTGYYSAQVISDTNGALPTTSLDLVTSIALAANSGVQTYVPVTATLGDPVFWVNTYSQNIAKAVISSGVVSTPGEPLNDIGYTFFSGATNVVPTLADYASAFNAALLTSGWTIITDTNMAGIAALGTQHAITASGITTKRYRRFFTGSSVGDTILQTITNARSLNSTTSSYVYPGIYRTDLVSGVNKLYGGLYAAAACAAMATGNRVAEPLTNKSLVGNGIEVALTVPDINQLQQAGVICLDVPESTGVPTIVSDLTTWQNDNNPENVFNQQIACRQYLAYSLLQTAQPYVGQIDSGVLSLGKVKNAITAALNALKYKGTGSSGILSSWSAASLVLSYTGATQTLSITVQVVFVGQNRFITIYVPVQPLNAVI